MAQEIIIPQLGDSITTALIARWHRADGETVRKGEGIVTLESDKVAPELEAEADGVLSIAVSEGEEVAIGTVIGSIAEGAVAPAPAVTTPKFVEEEVPVAEAPKPVVAPKPAQPSPPVDDDSRVSRKKMSPLRRKITSHLVNAQQTAAILTTFNEVDMTEVMKLRKSVQEDFIAKHGVKLGFMSFFVKAVVQALKDVPSINARIDGFCFFHRYLQNFTRECLGSQRTRHRVVSVLHLFQHFNGLDDLGI